MKKLIPFLFVLSIGAMERSPEWTDDDFTRMRDAYKKQREEDLKEVVRITSEVEREYDKRLRAIRVLKNISKSINERKEAESND